MGAEQPVRDGPRIPWEIVETLPGTDAVLVARWADLVARAATPAARARALVGHALTTYWAAQTGVSSEPWAALAEQRAEAVAEAVALARSDGGSDLLAEALLGTLHARWGPDHLLHRAPVVAELDTLHDAVVDPELRFQIRSWSVLEALDAGDARAAARVVDQLAAEAEGTDLVLFPRRVRLWRANLAMLRGEVDEAVAANQAVLADTAPTAGAPFSFQNAMVTFAIERYFRRGLADVVDPVRSVRASSPRVSANWDAALAFSLAQAGRAEEAAAVFEPLAAEGFSTVVRDLNWLVVVVILALTALELDDRSRAATLLDLLRPYAALDATHGSGYASYGPVGRVVGMLAGRCGEVVEGRRHLADVVGRRPPGPWTSLARLELGRLVADPGPAEVAADELAGFGLAAWADEARGLARDLRRSEDDGPSAERTGGTWTLRHASGEAVVRHGKGVEVLVRLLARPGEVVDAADLDGVDPDLPRRAVTEPVLDREARRAFRERLTVLERAARRRPGDEDEILAIRRALAGAAHAPSGSAELERTRVRVTKAVRRTIDAVATASPGLGAHLADTVSTGRSCVYAPPDGRAWRVRAHPDPPNRYGS
ncbi:MAG: hypothetical protein KF906_02360 [Actinobacteria bacterium]|nr:hypothetical protein [Actinomycetota bacterium]